MEAGGHSNVIKYNTWWGWGAVAYCVIGIAWAWIKAGATAFARGSRWANTDAMLADAKAGRNGLHLTNDPNPGCPGVIDFDGHSDPDHAITFVRRQRRRHLPRRIEFNTTGPNGMEGVWRKDRPLRHCWWFEVESLMADAYFTVEELRAAYPELANEAKYPDGEARASRASFAEQWFEAAAHVAYVPRERHRDADRHGPRAAVPVALGRGAARSRPRQDRRRRAHGRRARRADDAPRTASSSAPLRWPAGVHDRGHVPARLRRSPSSSRSQAVMMLAVEHAKPSTIPARATSLSTDVGSYRISQADATGKTGIPDVDAIIGLLGDDKPRDRHDRRAQPLGRAGRAPGGARRAGGVGRRRRRRGGAGPRLPDRDPDRARVDRGRAPRARSRPSSPAPKPSRRDLPTKLFVFVQAGRLRRRRAIASRRWPTACEAALASDDLRRRRRLLEHPELPARRRHGRDPTGSCASSSLSSARCW